MTSIVTANRLRDGVAVWLGRDGQWVEQIAEAELLEENAAGEIPDPAVSSGGEGVVDVRRIEARLVEGVPVPDARRERLRSIGPSVRADLAATLPGDRWASPPFPAPPSATSRSPYAGIYRYDEYDRQFLRDRAEQFRHQVNRRLSGELSEDEFKPLRLMNGLYLQLHGYMLRVALPYGVLSASQMRQLAYVARYYDRGYGHFTTRQNIQFNWPRLQDTPDILSVLAEADLHAIQTSGNCVRNVTTDHFAGAAAEEVVDPRLYAEILRQWSTDHPEFTYLPRKFKIAITGGPLDRAAVRVHDIGLLARRNAAGEPGFEIYAGGGLGRTPIIGTKVRDWLPVRDLLRYVESILRVYNALGRRDNIYKARIKILIREMKPENFITMIEEEFASLPPDYSVLEDEIVAEVAARFVPPPFAAHVIVSLIVAIWGGSAACVPGGHSRREAARVFGLSRDTVLKMCRFSLPPGYMRTSPVARPKLDAMVPVIDAILEEDRSGPVKQRHTAKRIFERLRDEHGFSGGYTIVKEYFRLKMCGGHGAAAHLPRRMIEPASRSCPLFGNLHLALLDGFLLFGRAAEPGGQGGEQVEHQRDGKGDLDADHERPRQQFGEELLAGDQRRLRRRQRRQRGGGDQFAHRIVAEEGGEQAGHRRGRGDLRGDIGAAGPARRDAASIDRGQAPGEADDHQREEHADRQHLPGIHRGGAHARGLAALARRAPRS